MAYNKSKYVEAAQKLLNQGKVTQAIAEYQLILRHEPKDQVTLMTVGELFIRQGETFQAIEYFERLAQIFVGDGFLTKAIAVYKRIAKLAPEEIRPLERLADLYVQQGVMSEARPLFLQLAEIHLKAGRQSEAVGLLKKLLLAEPDNIRIQIRLADLYQAMGQNGEAIEAYVSAAQRALARGDHAECEKLADKALKIDPRSTAAITVRARSSAAQGSADQAAQLLETAPGLEKGGEQAELLLDLYLKNHKWDEAQALATRVFEADEKNFGPLQKVVEAVLESGQTDRAMGLVARTREPMADAGEYEAVARLLNELVTRMPGCIEPLEWLVDIYGRTSDSFRLPDALAQLGDALSAAGQDTRAKEVFEKLVEREPESDSARRKLNDVMRKMGLLPPEAPRETLEPLVAELPEPEAPKLRPDEPESEAGESAARAGVNEREPALDDETQRFISQSLTDVDLFASYGLTQKAIGLLEAILRRAPRHAPTLEKLLDFVLGAGDDRRTAELAAQLESIHRERGDEHSAERFGELRRRFQRAAGLTDSDIAAGTAAAAESAAKIEAAEKEKVIESTLAPPKEGAAETPKEVHEVDLSEEWSSLVEQAHSEKAPPPAPAATGAPAAASKGPGQEEFHVPEESPATPAESSQPGSLEAALAAAPNPFAEIAAQPPETQKAPDTPAAQQPEPAPAAPAEHKAGAPEAQPEPDYDLVPEATPAEAQAAAGANAASHQAPDLASDQFLAELANEMGDLGLGELSPAFSEPGAPAEQPPAARAEKPAESGGLAPLKDVFEDFRAELGEMGAEEEDLETHYNLGIAFREMGLLDEAISEFQKVAKTNRPFRYAMQCCTLLGLAFMEKGQPSIAAIWYERALKTPGVDGESTLALRYDLGVAQETAGDSEAALKSFAQVYAVNIDYRDVAERIAALQKTAR